jgi:hypothetical protein
MNSDPYDYWCKPDAPQDLKGALLGGNQDKLRAWCKQNPERLSLALECIYPQHSVYRDIIQTELSAVQQKKAERAEERRHRQITFWAKVGVTVMIFGVVIGVVQCRFR